MVEETDNVDGASVPVTVLSGDELVAINAYTAMELTLERWVNGYV